LTRIGIYCTTIRLQKRRLHIKGTDPNHDPYRALRYRDFRFLLIGTFIASIGEQMVNVAIGWELYERTGSALALGVVGLVQVIPIILLSLPTNCSIIKSLYVFPANIIAQFPAFKHFHPMLGERQ